MKTKVTAAALEKLVNATDAAYSFDRYRNWQAVCRALLAAGLTHEQAVAVLLSKWTGWAADASGKRYGYATSIDLMKFVTQQGQAELVSLTAEHWGTAP